MQHIRRRTKHQDLRLTIKTRKLQLQSGRRFWVSIFQTIHEDDMESNKIVQTQNTDKNIARLASQRQLYNDVEFLDKINFCLSVIILLGFAAIQEIAGWDWAKVVSGCVSIFMLVLSLIISSKVKAKKTLAASIQQEFDIDVFQMPWDNKLFGKRKNLNSEIAKYSKKILNDDRKKNKLYNWYPIEVDSFPQSRAILVCQKENFNWDAGLRKRYRIFVLVFVVGIIIASVVICLLKGDSVQNLVLRFVIILPALRWFINVINGLNDDLERMESLKNALYSTDDKQMIDLQFIQKEIFENRKSAIKIPDWFYNIFRDNDEDRERRTVELSKK